MHEVRQESPRAWALVLAVPLRPLVLGVLLTSELVQPAHQGLDLRIGQVLGIEQGIRGAVWSDRCAHDGATRYSLARFPLPAISAIAGAL